uniref:Ubiquitin-like domain-containing protein n=1 Tax=Fagus sylvatica TaxID=28930 RepID=A0A2N9H4C5_FAGSY
MNVILETESGSPFSIEVGLFDTIREIKQKVEQDQGIPISNQTLIFNDSHLKDYLNIHHYDIIQDSHILLVIDDGRSLSCWEMESNGRKLKVYAPSNYVFGPSEIDSILEADNFLGPITLEVPSNAPPSLSKIGSSSKLNLKVLITCGTKEKEIPVEVIESDNIKVLRNEMKKLEKKLDFRLPEEDYSFFRNNSVLEEDESFLWSNIAQGDTINVATVFHPKPSDVSESNQLEQKVLTMPTCESENENGTEVIPVEVKSWETNRGSKIIALPDDEGCNSYVLISNECCQGKNVDTIEIKGVFNSSEAVLERPSETVLESGQSGPSEAELAPPTSGSNNRLNLEVLLTCHIWIPVEVNGWDNVEVLRNQLQYDLPDGGYFFFHKDELIGYNTYVRLPQLLSTPDSKPSAGSKLKLTIETSDLRRRFVVEVFECDKVQMLRTELEKEAKLNFVSLNESTFFLYNHGLMMECRSFVYHHIRNGDTIQMFEEFVYRFPVPFPRRTAGCYSLKLKALTACGKEIPVEVTSSNNVEELWNKLDYSIRIQREGYSLFHKYIVLCEDRTFLWNHVQEGDTIEIKP